MISRARCILRRLREMAAEIDYAHRRLLEIRTGIPFTQETERALARAEIRRLEVLYAQADPGLEAICDPEPDSQVTSTLHPPGRR